MGWGDAPGASTEELIHALAKFDPHGLAQALGRDEDHTAWFDGVCEALLPHYAYSLGSDHQKHPEQPLPQHLPVIAVRQRQADYEGQPLAWPPGWEKLWGPASFDAHRHLPPVVRHDVIPTAFNLPIP